MLKFLLCFDVKFLKIYDRTNTQGNRLAESSVIKVTFMSVILVMVALISTLKKVHLS